MYICYWTVDGYSFATHVHQDLALKQWIPEDDRSACVWLIPGTWKDEE